MASIQHEAIINVSADKAWSTLRQHIGEPFKLFAPVLKGGHVNNDVRTVEFANGLVVDERIIDIDDTRRRLAYSVINSPRLAHHHASMQFIPDGVNHCRFIWISDFLPAEASQNILPLVEQGTLALKRNLEEG